MFIKIYKVRTFHFQLVYNGKRFSSTFHIKFKN